MTIPPEFATGEAASGSLNTRRVNRQRLLEAVRRSGPISRADLAKATRLSPPTVSALVEDLLHEVGLMHEVGMGTSRGGRPPVLLQFNGEFGYLVGVDVGSRTLRVALADLQGKVLARRQVPTDPAGGVAIVDQLCAVVREVFATTRRDPAKLYAVGVGAPGMTDVHAGRVIRAVNLAGWVDLPLRDLVEARLGAPVRVDNDANMAALGERWQGSARRVSDFVFLALGAGIGAGVVVGGRLHRGHHWYAGEISHMNLDMREWQADFGDRGYLESHVGAAAIAESQHADAATIITAARAGDARAMAVIDQLAVYLGTAVANIVAVLDPALVVFGGGLSHAGDLLIEPVRRVVARIVPNMPAIGISSLGDDAQLMGAVYSAVETAETRLAAWLGATSFPSRAVGRTGTR
ncbi:MAG TPA: ROK family transcriptional regulator [Vicinamibacterales bacterium]|nr:ROK family transcriptional regulator [Vicinamibacterales bacterium]